jgi:hypothetical protein
MNTKLFSGKGQRISHKLLHESVKMLVWKVLKQALHSAALVRINCHCHKSPVAFTRDPNNDEVNFW